MFASSTIPPVRSCGPRTSATCLSASLSRTCTASLLLLVLCPAPALYLDKPPPAASPRNRLCIMSGNETLPLFHENGGSSSSAQGTTENMVPNSSTSLPFPCAVFALAVAQIRSRQATLRTWAVATEKKILTSSTGRAAHECISDDALIHLKSYKYSSVDKSPVSKYILGPWVRRPPAPFLLLVDEPLLHLRCELMLTSSSFADNSGMPLSSSCRYGSLPTW